MPQLIVIEEPVVSDGVTFCDSWMFGVSAPLQMSCPPPELDVPTEKKVAVPVEVDVNCGNEIVPTGDAVAGPEPVTVQPAVDRSTLTRA